MLFPLLVCDKARNTVDENIFILRGVQTLTTLVENRGELFCRFIGIFYLVLPYFSCFITHFSRFLSHLFILLCLKLYLIQDWNRVSRLLLNPVSQISNFGKTLYLLRHLLIFPKSTHYYITRFFGLSNLLLYSLPRKNSELQASFRQEIGRSNY